MPATPIRIGFVLREQRIVESVSGDMEERYGAVARDPKDEPFDSYCDDPADAQTLSDERLDLVGTERRRFSTDAKGELDLDFSTTTPAATLIDDERQADLPCAIVSITEDAGASSTNLLLWG